MPRRKKPNFDDFPTELIPIEDITDHPENYQSHPEEQIQHLKKSLEDYGFWRPVVISHDNFILAGHGITKAARELGIKQVPVVRMAMKHDHPYSIKLMIADNETGIMAKKDKDQMTDLLRQISDFNIEDLLGTGFNDQFLTKLGIIIPEEDYYSKKIQAPIYEPNGKKPKIVDLLDLTKTEELIQEIDNADISHQLKKFLKYAAYRHLVFDYEKIANFYAHSSKEIQTLMENSALVIIDFDRAIELGYVKLSKQIANLYEQDYPNDD